MGRGLVNIVSHFQNGKGIFLLLFCILYLSYLGIRKDTNDSSGSAGLLCGKPLGLRPGLQHLAPPGLAAGRGAGLGAGGRSDCQDFCAYWLQVQVP